MKDKQLQILVLTKLYQLNRNQENANTLKKDAVFEDIDPKQLNFCFQYLGTMKLIDNAYSNNRGVYYYIPQTITGTGMDIVESLMSKISSKNKIFENASSVIDKITVFLVEASTNSDIWDALIKIFNQLIKALMGIS